MAVVAVAVQVHTDIEISTNSLTPTDLPLLISTKQIFSIYALMHLHTHSQSK